ncbi:MAG: PKD domain-containing protein [Nitrospinae bacterium]|nr:PKD domain-containing protein [Nitrospinota bacterium]
MSTRFLAQFLIIPTFLAVIAGCGASIDKEKGSSSGATSAKLQLTWPEGYRYDPATRKLTAPSSFVRREAPFYVTSVTMTVSGPDMEPMTVDVPLDTLTVDLTVTFGERYFDVLVETEYGDTFTGSETAAVSPFGSPVLVIELEVNAPPVITGIEMSIPEPRPGDTISVTGYAEDPDADDELTYAWYAYGLNGSESASGQTVTGSVPIEGGQFTIILVVDDGHGGVASQELTFDARGTAPVILGMTASNTAPKIGDVVNLYGYATDDDPGDTLTYEWTVTDPKGSSYNVQGDNASMTISSTGAHEVTLTVTDLQGNYATSSMTIDVICNYGTPQAPINVTAAAGTGSSIVISYQYPGGGAGETSDGIAVYNLSWKDVTLTTTGWKGGYSRTGSITYSCTQGHQYNFQVSAGNSCYVAGSYSAWTGQIICP